MPEKNADIRAAAKSASRHGIADVLMGAGMAAVMVFFIIVTLVSYSNTRLIQAETDHVLHSHDVITGLTDILSAVKDAETGQRGYIITGDDKYLDTYRTGLSTIETRIGRIETLTADNPDQQVRIPPLRRNIETKLRELEETITLRREKGFQAAYDVVVTDRGKEVMDSLRAQITEMRQEELRLRQQRLDVMNQAHGEAIVSAILTGIIGLILTMAVGYLVRRTVRARRREAWLQQGQAGLAAAMLGDQTIDELGNSILKFIAEYLDAHAGTFYVKSLRDYRRIATYGVPADSKVPERFMAGDGLLGQAAKDQRAFFVDGVPDSYLTIASSLGRSSPRHLAISPTVMDGEVNAVFELGFLHKPEKTAITLFQSMAETIGTAVRSANYRAHLQDLLEETQRQAEELQTQSEELRVSNEELEEQSAALKASQHSLEQQQAELEQTNSQLEEQTQILEIQRDDLERTRDAVQMKARELEQASQYKSDFLANMSHELRTPLNSSLILAKLLADNKAGNLTDEQVKFAQTIQSSGNDLLALINDILDLSKIEAGHMDITPGPVDLKVLSSDITRMFKPLTDNKGLMFDVSVTSGAPSSVVTDRLRLEQVLKNLLSNAVKFTDKGRVSLTISRTDDGQISFAVRDTGIGIAEEQQRAVFDAFRQADGTISRKYGGTGLGLSISRQLARLLGGRIALTSALGEGSTFSIILPETYNGAGDVVMDAPIAVTAPKKATSDAKDSGYTPARRLPDDRDQLVRNGRIILVVEDDESFATILYELAHQQGFQCLIATTAEDALIAIRQYQPSAVLMDVGLPDHSGLTVLDRLKHDPHTRHIPVHVVSANDYSHTAFSLGAVGYMLKPVKHDDLAEAFRKLETRLDQKVRHILVVEDDSVQRDSVCRLLAAPDVDITAVGTASECLAQLKEKTFDCMVLDLSLPDASGYSLLETLAQEDKYAFPPVIVYTGRALSADDEQKLRRYSKSIIIKGAKSPERLLDEVTLFLHQVESELPEAQQRMLEKARNRDSALEGRRILVVEDDVRNVYAVTNIFEPHGVHVQIARNGREGLAALEKAQKDPEAAIDLVLMDVMMPEMDGITATQEIRKNAAWKKLPIIMLTAKAMRDDQERCLAAGANDYMAKPLDVEKLVSLVRVWMPR